MIDLYPKPFGDHGPKLKRPPMYDGALDGTLVQQICALLLADASLARPRGGAVWWADKDADEIAEAEAAFRAVAAANPKVLKLDDSAGAMKALYLTRIPDCASIATIYFNARDSK